MENLALDVNAKFCQKVQTVLEASLSTNDCWYNHSICLAMQAYPRNHLFENCDPRAKNDHALNGVASTEEPWRSAKPMAHHPFPLCENGARSFNRRHGATAQCSECSESNVSNAVHSQTEASVQNSITTCTHNRARRNHLCTMLRKMRLYQQRKEHVRSMHHAMLTHNPGEIDCNAVKN